MAKKHRIPSYRRHKPSGQAVVTLNGRDHYLGKWGTASSREQYGRLIARWSANDYTLPPKTDPTDNGLSITELIAAYWRFARTYYRKDGKPTSERGLIRCALRPLKRLYGRTAAEEFGPIALKNVRDAMIQNDLVRITINRNIGRVVRMFKWATENELIGPDVYHALRAVSGLREGRTEARESEPVRPVPDEHVDAVLNHVPATVAAMIELQRLTGMRSGEVTIMRGADLDMTGRLWTFTPERHKTEHHGHARVVYLGPHAQEIIRPYLKPDLSAYLFCPIESEAVRNAERRANRRSPMTPSQRSRRPSRRPRRPKRDHYDAASYRRCIRRACDLADVPKWHPHQLRHNAATRLRRQFGIEAARVVLGHRSAAVTEIYAEIDQAKAAEIMARIG